MSWDDLHLFSFNEVVCRIASPQTCKIKEQEKEFINTPSITSDLKQVKGRDVSKTALHLKKLLSLLALCEKI